MADRREQRGYRLHDYSRADYYAYQHYQRYYRYVNAHGLMCQECGGRGRALEDRVEQREIRIPCGWCEGTGLVTRRMRGH